MFSEFHFALSLPPLYAADLPPQATEQPPPPRQLYDCRRHGRAFAGLEEIAFTGQLPPLRMSYAGCIA